VIAYTFFHWPSAGVAEPEYEVALAEFFRGLLGSGSGSPGLRSSWTVRFDAVPWLSRRPVYQDWYQLTSTAGLDALESAVRSSMSAGHDTIARLAGGGSGGLFALRSSLDFVTPREASECRVAWIDKPAFAPYGPFLEALAAGGGPGVSVWQRRLALGPGREFCLWLPPGMAMDTRSDPALLPPSALVVTGFVVAAGEAASP
jgi:hypothetical protein